MAPESFAPARRAALHCEALVARGAGPADELAVLAGLGRALAAGLPERLEPLFQAGPWRVRAGACEWLGAADVPVRIGAVAGNVLLPVGDAGGRLFASFAPGPLAARVTQLFGGPRDEGAGALASARLPASLALVLRRLGTALSETLAGALAPAALRQADELRVDADFAALGLLPGAARAAVLPLSLANEAGAPLELLLGARKALLGRLAPHLAAADAPLPSRRSAAGLGGAAGDIPVPLVARLAEMALPLRRIAMLRPGEVLPLAVARQVPLIAGGRIIATGTLGEQDDRVALAIEKVLIEGEGG